MQSSRAFRRLVLLALVAAVPQSGSMAAALQGVTQGDVTDKIVNDPRPEAFNPYGTTVPARIVRDKGVQFGKVLRIPIQRAEREDWRIGLTIPVIKPVKAGDRVVVAFWARATGTEGGAPGKIARVQLEEARPPHRALFAQPVVVGSEWKMHQVQGAADRDYGPQDLSAAMHLATARQVMEIGPVFILRYPR